LITCYAQPDKAKSQRLLEAFAAGCGGGMASTRATELLPGAAAFYGVRPPWLHLWQQAEKESRTWYWLDNSWFDATRETYFRIGCNEVQSWSTTPSDGKRLAQIGVKVQPWRKTGKHILICPQSDEFMIIAGWNSAAAWVEYVTGQLRKETARPIIVRSKKDKRSFAQDLSDAWLVVVDSSAAAVEALLAGVPVIVTDRNSVAAGFSTPFEEIERPHYKLGRESWAARLADSQWTLEELKNGTAWRMLNAK
jgi:hypothetical protein